MLSELKAVFDVVDRVLEGRNASAQRKTRDKVLIAIYTLGNDGTEAVTAERLETEGGFSKLQMSNAIAAGKSEGWILDMSGLNDRAWALNREGQYYVEALLTDK